MNNKFFSRIHLMASSSLLAVLVLGCIGCVSRPVMHSSSYPDETILYDGESVSIVRADATGTSGQPVEVVWRPTANGSHGSRPKNGSKPKGTPKMNAKPGSL